MSISDAVIHRLPVYYRYLKDMEKDGIVQISSHELGRRMNITPSQVRQDINSFGGIGRQGYGYPVHELLIHIGKILGLDRNHNIIIIGAGNIGGALVGHKSFESNGFKTHAIFDNDPKLHGKELSGIPIYPMDDIKNFIKKNKVEIAVLAIPAEAAQKIADMLIKYGIKAIWNFASLDLKLPSSIAYQSVHLSESLQTLSFKLLHMNENNESNEKH